MNDTMTSIMMIVAAVIGISVGIVIVRKSPKSILSWDRRTGHSIYRNTVESTGDKEKALYAAGDFYMAFGVIIILSSLLFLLGGLVMLLVK